MKTFSNYLFIALGIFFLAGCGSTKQELKPPNIVWIVSEDNSKHYLKHFDENGVSTPNIEALAQHGVTFTRAFSNGAVCSVARSTIISGCYAPRTGTQFHRKSQMVPMPDSLRMFPAYLRKAGYYTGNNSKEDYNFIKDEDAWTESSNKAHWSNRSGNQPFFYVHNIGLTHESSLHFPESDLKDKPTSTDPETTFVEPNHPQSDVFKYTNARYRDLIAQMDKLVGEVVTKLEADNLLDSTFVFYYGDHGGVLPGSKGYIHETGLHVPLVVYVPKAYAHLVNQEVGTYSDRFVSFVDLAPTVLALAGSQIPKQIDGKAFLGANAGPDADVTYGYADRFDEKYDMVRSVRKGKYKYLRNYQPYYPDALMNDYRYKQATYRDWENRFRNGELNDIQSAFFQPKRAEQLFDVEADPYETNNLADAPEYLEELGEMRELLTDWVRDMPDLSFYPENFLRTEAFGNTVGYGRLHKGDISNYITIADLQLSSFKAAKPELKNALSSSDPWMRYWGLIALSSLGESDEETKAFVKQILENDPLLINRARAFECLALLGADVNPDDLVQLSYESEDDLETLLMLNTIVFLKDFYDFKFDINVEKIRAKFPDNSNIEARLIYLAKSS